MFGFQLRNGIFFYTCSILQNRFTVFIFFFFSNSKYYIILFSLYIIISLFLSLKEFVSCVTAGLHFEHIVFSLSHSLRYLPFLFPTRCLFERASNINFYRTSTSYFIVLNAVLHCITLHVVYGTNLDVSLFFKTSASIPFFSRISWV